MRIGRITAWAFVLVFAPAAALAGDPKADAVDYVKKNVAPLIESATAIKGALVKANADRASWGPYSADWKKWTAADAGKQPDSYAKCEYRWSSQKDKALRDECTSGEAASAMKAFQDKSGGKVGEFFVVDAKGGNVAQSQLTSDWFQGDEDKFAKVANQKDLWADEPRRDDTIGKIGVQVSVPIWSTADGKEAFIGVAVVTVILDGPAPKPGQ